MLLRSLKQTAERLSIQHLFRRSRIFKNCRIRIRMRIVQIMIKIWKKEGLERLISRFSRNVS